jgi:hypothetical protein
VFGLSLSARHNTSKTEHNMGRPKPQPPLEPPPDLPPDQAKIWRRIIAAMPAGFFTADNEFVLRAMVAGAVAEAEKDNGEAAAR